jgi:hypothetical protein
MHMPEQAVAIKEAEKAKQKPAKRRMVTIDGNTAAAYVAHATN